MTQGSIFRLEPFDRFTRRIVELNRLYNPEDPLHDLLLADGARGDAALARKKLATIHKEFPHGAPLPEQGAFLLRAFSGLAIFGDANFRTGWDYWGELLTHGGHDIVASLDDAEGLRLELWDRLQDAYPHGFQRKDALDRDETIDFTAEWLRRRLA